MKKIALILAALMLAVSLIACNNTDAEEGDNGKVSDTKVNVKTSSVLGTQGDSDELVTVGTVTYDDEKGKNVIIAKYSGLSTNHTVKLEAKFVHENTEYIATKIGNEAFYHCASVTEIELPSTITSIGDWAFTGSGIEKIVIPASVKYIGKGAFAKCENLTEVIFEEGSQLVSIDDYAFDGCVNLTTITIPEGVESIGAGAFHDCESITSLKTPSTLKSIDDGAFIGCTGLNAAGALDVSASVNIETRIENVAGEKVEIVCLGREIFGGINKDYIIAPEDATTNMAKYIAAMTAVQTPEH